MAPDEDPTLQQFWQRLYADWLPTYCRDPKRNYTVEGFSKGNTIVSAVDARDFMRAIDTEIVRCDSGGRFTMPRSNATEVIFWEHERNTVPRKITLWLEPLITIAAVARLHLDYGWPLECLGMQSKDYAFDLTTFLPGDIDNEHIAGEVKPTTPQLNSLMRHLNYCCSNGAHDDCLGSSTRKNAHRKWLGLVRSRPPLFWAIGPDGDNRAFDVAYEDGLPVSLTPADTEKLRFRTPNKDS